MCKSSNKLKTEKTLCSSPAARGSWKIGGKRLLQLNLRLTLSEISALFLPTRCPFLHVLITETFSNTGSPEGSHWFQFPAKNSFSVTQSLRVCFPFLGFLSFFCFGIYPMFIWFWSIDWSHVLCGCLDLQWILSVILWTVWGLSVLLDMWILTCCEAKWR
jgi:hypothetical protein